MNTLRTVRTKRAVLISTVDVFKVPIAVDETSEVVTEGLQPYGVNRRWVEQQFADAAVDFLRTRSGEGPFFCYLAFTAPHDPRNPPQPFREMYYRDRPPLPHRPPPPARPSGLPRP